MLSGDDIRCALLALAAELETMSAHCELAVVGGAAVVLLYGARAATKDVDMSSSSAAASRRSSVGQFSESARASGFPTTG